MDACIGTQKHRSVVKFCEPLALDSCTPIMHMHVTSNKISRCLVSVTKTQKHCVLEWHLHLLYYSPPVVRHTIYTNWYPKKAASHFICFSLYMTREMSQVANRNHSQMLWRQQTATRQQHINKTVKASKFQAAYAMQRNHGRHLLLSLIHWHWSNRIDLQRRE